MSDMPEPRTELTTYFTNIDKAKTFVEQELAGHSDWQATHPGMVLDTYIYDLAYNQEEHTRLRAFKYIKLEMV